MSESVGFSSCSALLRERPEIDVPDLCLQYIQNLQWQLTKLPPHCMCSRFTMMTEATQNSSFSLTEMSRRAIVLPRCCKHITHIKPRAISSVQLLNAQN